MTKTPDNFSWLNSPADEAALKLLGCELEREISDEIIRVKIVEVEAYDQNDLASHTFNGETSRNHSMFLSAGHLYVYFTYGMHYCCNIVCGEAGFGAGVLIRAVEPLANISLIEKNRNLSGKNVTNGPAKTCQALKIDKNLDGHFLADAPLKLIKQGPLKNTDIVTTTRIGITKASEKLRRFYIKDNPFVSKQVK